MPRTKSNKTTEVEKTKTTTKTTKVEKPKVAKITNSKESKESKESKTTSNKLKKILTPLKAIRQKCLDCCCYQAKEVKACPCEDCSLWDYRLGRNPNRKSREYTEEEKQNMKERMSKARSSKNA